MGDLAIKRAIRQSYLQSLIFRDLTDLSNQRTVWCIHESITAIQGGQWAELVQALGLQLHGVLGLLQAKMHFLLKSLHVVLQLSFFLRQAEQQDRSIQKTYQGLQVLSVRILFLLLNTLQALQQSGETLFAVR